MKGVMGSWDRLVSRLLDIEKAWGDRHVTSLFAPIPMTYLLLASLFGKRRVHQKATSHQQGRKFKWGMLWVNILPMFDSIQNLKKGSTSYHVI